jgi:hypothetical protein
VVFGSQRSSFRVDFVPVRSQVGATFLSAIFGFSHWFLAHRTVVRDGIGAETPVPPRLYHMLGACHGT